MDFTFGEDRELFASTLREVLDDRCGPAAVRASWDDPAGRVDGLWTVLAETGILGLLVPEDHGGLGMDERDLVLLLEELGRAACPDPVAEHAAVVVPVLRDLASEASRERWLPGLADGSVVATAGSPVDRPVLAGGSADLVLLAVDGALHAVPGDAVAATAQAGVDGSRRLATVEATTSADTLVSDDLSAVDVVLDRGAWAAAAQGLGVVQRLLDLTVEYVSEREQFGRPVGANQAVKHHCSNVAIALEFARPLVHVAAWTLATGRLPEGTVPPAPDPRSAPLAASVAASMAKAAVSDALDLACRSALQCHGAIGYTIEYDLQLWLKRGWALSASWGDARHHRRRIAAGLGLASDRPGA